ncbi:MAG: serine hydrolase, partial [Alphaproteobacteria bacterium]|nr:serine hydrolase [Alphaproteobacteria bacterium]
AEYYYHEEAMGWRLPLDLANEDTQRKFLPRIENTGKYPASPFVKYKDANTEVLIWLIERVSGKALRNHLADIIDAAGIESHFAMSCDRDGVPVMDGGGCFTLRDLARYGTIFTRGCVGIIGEPIGNGDWTRETLKGGVAWSDDTQDAASRYHNHLETDGRGIGHAGYCGQYLYADLTSGTVVAHFSVTTEKDGICDDHYAKIWAMSQEVTRL